MQKDHDDHNHHFDDENHLKYKQLIINDLVLRLSAFREPDVNKGTSFCIMYPLRPSSSNSTQ